jgi:hypothetical protein
MSLVEVLIFAQRILTEHGNMLLAVGFQTLKQGLNVFKISC